MLPNEMWIIDAIKISTKPWLLLVQCNFISYSAF